MCTPFLVCLARKMEGGSCLQASTFARTMPCEGLRSRIMDLLGG